MKRDLTEFDCVKRPSEFAEDMQDVFQYGIDNQFTDVKDLVDQPDEIKADQEEVFVDSEDDAEFQKSVEFYAINVSLFAVLSAFISNVDIVVKYVYMYFTFWNGSARNDEGDYFNTTNGYIIYHV